MDKLLRGYSSPFNLGHKALQDFFEGTVHVQEKIDGSQISFGYVKAPMDSNDDQEVWNLSIRSRRQEINQLDPGMFALAVETIKELNLVPGYTYRGEYLSKPKHNTLVYDFIPPHNIIIFDIDMGDQDYMLPAGLHNECERIGLTHVPYFATFHDKIPTMEKIEQWLEHKSCLGNVTVEGLVFKNYDRYGIDKKVLMAKYVSPEFREKHDKSWGTRNPGQKAFIGMLIEKLATEARWAKARQHLQEQGEDMDKPQDIPLLMKEISSDIYEEEGEQIKEELFKHYWKEISRGVTKGMPEWFKKVLAEEALTQDCPICGKDNSEGHTCLAQD